MTYQETLDYLFTKLPMFSRVGASAYKEDLTNTILLCDALRNPQSKLKCIHIAGTNGKGSTSHMLAAILQSAGYKTGLYTSPHLKDFRERIKINGNVCDEQFVIDFTNKIQPLIESIQPSFFEITVAMAFEYFAEQQVDIAVIETGLGGRLDSTNIITPLLSIITNIGFDHMALLGNTLPKIAHEKAGIIKQKVPVVIGESFAETRKVFIEKSKHENSPIYFAQENKKVTNINYTHHQLQVTIEDIASKKSDNFILDLTGIYQTKNLCTILESVNQLQKIGYQISNEQLKFALQNTKKLTGLHGRWELLQNNPTLIADVGHNEDGIRQILQQLQITQYNQLHIIIGMVKDKDIDQVLSLLPKNATYYFTKAQIPRALDEAALQDLAKQQQLIGNTYSNVNEAINIALQTASANDLIIVCGSVFLVGEIDMHLVNESTIS
jgi:dihydrofolate synthase/folylpolyglutamate synthase